MDTPTQGITKPPKRGPGRPARISEGGLIRTALTMEVATDALLRTMAGRTPLTRFVEDLILEEAKRRGLIE